MASPLVLHQRTKVSVAQYLAEPSNALLLVGPDGVGKTALAEHIAQTALDTNRPLAEMPYAHVVQPVNGTIPIDAVRTIQRFLQLKTAGTNPLRRVVLIEHADGLTTEAQNALLKSLEEPPRDTLMILTAATSHSLLPTILSRVQPLAVQAPSEADLRTFFGETHTTTQVTQAYFLSGGLPGLMQALLDDDQTHPLRASVEQAKLLLRMTTFERLAQVDQLTKKKGEAQSVLEALQRIAQAGLSQASAKHDEARVKQWHKIRKLTHEAHAALMHNASPKLTLTNIMLHI